LQVKYRYIGELNGTYQDYPATIHGPLRINYVLSERTLNGTVAGAACLTYALGKRCVQIRDADDLGLLDEMIGNWALILNVTESDRRLSGNAVVRTSTGREVPFTATGMRKLSGIASITLRGVSNATGVILRVTADEAMNLRTVRGKIFGQTLRISR
jgi:hypothetical protein